jgi:hypothetical protein
MSDIPKTSLLLVLTFTLCFMGLPIRASSASDLPQIILQSPSGQYYVKGSNGALTPVPSTLPLPSYAKGNVNEDGFTVYRLITDAAAAAWEKLRGNYSGPVTGKGPGGSTKYTLNVRLSGSVEAPVAIASWDGFDYTVGGSAKPYTGSNPLNVRRTENGLVLTNSQGFAEYRLNGEGAISYSFSHKGWSDSGILYKQ